MENEIENKGETLIISQSGFKHTSFTRYVNTILKGDACIFFNNQE